MTRYRDDRSYDRDYDRQDYRGRGGNSDRPRDENGRFMSEDDNRGGYRNDSRFNRGGSSYDRDDSRGYGSYDRPRDENGRFMSYDDNRGGYRGNDSYGHSSRSNYDRDYDPQDYRGRGGNSNRLRDENGRFMSEDDSRGGYRGNVSYGRSSRSSYDRDDSRGYGSYDRPRDENGRFMSEDDGRSGARSQSHRGKGPKGHQRSDDRIKEMVSDALEDSHDVDASEIEVKVEGGEVTLTGTVNDRMQKRHAEDCVEGLRGVKDVHNQIRVQRQDGSETSSGNSSSGRDGRRTTSDSNKS